MLDLAPEILMVILIIATYLLLLEHLSQYLENRRFLGIFAGTLLLVYGCAVGFVILLYRSLNSNPIILMGALLAGVAVMLVYLVKLIIKNWDTTDRVMLLLLGVYCLVVIYLTILIRIGASEINQVSMTPFKAFRYMLSTWTPRTVGDTIRNICMYIPIGFLVPLINPVKCRHISFAAIFGIITSTGIETAQLIGKLGYCDIDDIINNTVGAVLGYLLCMVFLSVRKNWRVV